MGTHNHGGRATDRQTERPTAAALSYSPITILKLRIRLRRLRNYCKVEAGRRREREREGEGEEIRLGPHSEFRQTCGRGGGKEGGREGERERKTKSDTQPAGRPSVRPSVRSFVALLEFVLRGSPFFPRVHHGLPNLGARAGGGQAARREWERAKTQSISR